VDALVAHRSEAPQEALLSAAQMATLLSSYAGTRRVADPDATEAAQEGPPEPWRLDVDVSAATALLLALSCNAHAVCDAELRPLGRGVYPVAACANHSCSPVSALTFRGLRAQLRALATLRPGDEITLAYVDVCAPAAERRAELRRGYFFDCRCDRCASALAQGGSEDDRALVRHPRALHASVHVSRCGVRAGRLGVWGVRCCAPGRRRQRRMRSLRRASAATASARRRACCSAAPRGRASGCIQGGQCMRRCCSRPRSGGGGCARGG
jgi:hypothetical protein